MATPIVIASCIRITLVMTQEGSQRINRFHFLTDGAGPFPAPALQALASDFYAVLVAPYYKPLANANVNFDRVEALDMTTPIGQVGVYVPPQPQAGGAAGEALPANATAALSLKTGYSGRRFRGRSFFVGLSEASSSGSTLGNGSIVSLVALASRFLIYSGTATIPGSMAIASYTYHLLTRIAAVSVDAFIDSMRRRLINRGR